MGSQVAKVLSYGMAHCLGSSRAAQAQYSLEIENRVKVIRALTCPSGMTLGRPKDLPRNYRTRQKNPEQGSSNKITFTSFR
jgi:hypothetical protein